MTLTVTEAVMMDGSGDGCKAMGQNIGELEALERRASDAARLLKLVANERRLLILCTLASKGESCVGDLSETVGLGQSAMSQHLAKMRDEGLVSFRRESQTVFYSISDQRCAALLGSLKDIFCA